MEIRRGLAGTHDYLAEVKRMLDTLPDQIEPLVEELYRAYVDERIVFLIGNGGSAANASHFGQDLSKGTVPHLGVTKRFRTIALTDNVSFITALANDEGYDRVFVEQLVALGRTGDVLVAISGSGNSANVLRAVEYAHEHGMRTIGITGFGGGTLGQLATVNVNVPCDDIGLVEAIHSVVFHLVMTQLRKRIAVEWGSASRGR